MGDTIITTDNNNVKADISTLEMLQNQANASMGFGHLSAFNDVHEEDVQNHFDAHKDMMAEMKKTAKAYDNIIAQCIAALKKHERLPKEKRDVRKIESEYKAHYRKAQDLWQDVKTRLINKHKSLVFSDDMENTERKLLGGAADMQFSRRQPALGRLYDELTR